jgi:hypothetical protein
MLIGVFVMGMQLKQRYFSDVSFGGGFGGFGGLFSGFGSGGSATFGNLFSSSAYSLKTR